jgi:hypothetical protein
VDILSCQARFIFDAAYYFVGHRSWETLADHFFTSCATQRETSFSFNRPAMLARIFFKVLSHKFINSLVGLLHVRKLEIKLTFGGNNAYYHESMLGIVS